MAEQESSNKKRFVIGLDFGTTYTGFAYSDSSLSPDDVHSIQIVHEWPGTGSNTTKEKVPSQIAYGNFHDGETEAWGFLIPPNVKRHSWLKLRLDKAIEWPELQFWRFITGGIENLDLGEKEDDSDDNPPAPPGKRPVDMITDYLRGVNNHAIKCLEKQFGTPLLKTMAFEVVVTVPAVWSDRAKDLTYKAVGQAGFGSYKFQMSMVTEPEAAAVYTLKALKAETGGSSIQVGDQFVLCDAGGGTVDIISYKVCSVSPHFQVEEAAIGTGDKCGSTFIDRSFKKWLKKKLGATDYDRIKKERLMIGSKIMNEFESLKMQFTGTRPHGQKLTLPRELGIDDDPSRNIEDGEILVTPDDLREMFDPHVNRTLELIEEQVETVTANGGTVKHILLVGGFGGSDYLFKRVQEYAGPHDIEVRKPRFPWSSVVRGAVARGLEAEGNHLVRVRMCRRHYGTPVSQSWDPYIHDEDDAYTDELTNAKMARGQMKWLLEKGDTLNASEPKRAAIECCRTFKPSDSRMFGAQLAACDENFAPRRYQDNSVYNICRLRADLSSVPTSKFLRARSRVGGDYYFIGMVHGWKRKCCACSNICL
ncbi:actin-like ATPase domain-containing protein [Wilcoxina mikolae CBS 423.85]|nr:actin-like ATPase domain-containing protein [Wilcoxina mikolae CBS 423.85]